MPYAVVARRVGGQPHLHGGRIGGRVGAVPTVVLARACAVSPERRARRVDRRHAVAGLARKPQALGHSQPHDDLLPGATRRHGRKVALRQIANDRRTGVPVPAATTPALVATTPVGRGHGPQAAPPTAETIDKRGLSPPPALPDR